MRDGRRGLLLLLASAALAAPALAQDTDDERRRPASLPPGAVVQPLDDGPGAELRRYLTELGRNPGSLSALIGAGRAALEMEDGQAALTFFSRAEEVAPTDARAKAGMASAMALIGQPRAALNLFEEAVSLGAPEIEIAADRGLAYDLAGDPRRAQQDYQLVLRRRDGAEVRRRMALSLAISGQRAEALRLIDPQLRRNDRAAWRTQAFVLALTGDTAGANLAARAVMPAGIADAMAPFMARLAGLNPAEKAAAVHLGAFPGDGSGSAMAAASAPPTIARSPSDVAAVRQRPDTIPAGSSATETRPAPPPAIRIAEAPPRRFVPDPQPRATPPVAAGSVPRRLADAPPTRIPDSAPSLTPETEAAPRRFAPNPVPAATPPSPPVDNAPVRLAEPSPTRVSEPIPPLTQATEPPRAPVEPTLPPPAVQELPAATAVQGQAPATTDTGTMPTGIVAIVPPASQPALAVASPAQTPTQSGASPSPGFTLTPQGPQPASPPAVLPQRRLAEIADLVRSLPRDASPPAAPARVPTANSARREARSAATVPTERRETRTQRPAPPAHPARHWVQIAGGANRTTLPREFARLRGLAPQLLGSRTAYTTPLRATNRLLVGPFRTTREAQALVNQLSERNLSAFAWTSEAGQEIERLQTPR